MDKMCTSCGVHVMAKNNFVEFECPECENKLIRCRMCKESSVNYKCSECDFMGP